jgi:multiple sugar transport system substrate-binding protein
MRFLLLLLFTINSYAVELEYWRHHQPAEYQAMNELIVQFEKENPHIKIKLVTLPYSTLVNKLAATLATGTGPDLINIHNSWAYSYIKNDLIIPLRNKSFSSKQIKKDFFPMTTAFAKEDQQYCIPIGGSNLAVFYNKKHMSEKKDLNWRQNSWENFTNLAKALTQYDKHRRLKRSGATVCSIEEQSWGYLLEGLVIQNGGDLVKNNRVQWNSKEGEEALRYYTDFCKKHYVYSYSFPKPSTAFILELASTTITGSWFIPQLKRDAPQIEFGTFELPSKVKKSTSGTLWGTCLTKKINNDKKKIKAAEKFLKYLSLYSSMTYWSEQTGEVPLRKEVLEDSEFQASHPLMIPFIKQMPYSVVSLKKNENKYKYYIQRAIERVLLQDVTPKEALNEAEKGVNKMLEEF